MSIVAKSKENFNKCRCAKCPSFTFGCKIKATTEHIANLLKKDISNEKNVEFLFCAFEKSQCITEDKGCICTTCAVHSENDLSNMYFCMANGGKP